MAHLLIHSFEKLIASLPYMPGTAKAWKYSDQQDK